MDWQNIVQILLTATIPSFLTFLATKKSNDSKIKEITISKNSEIQQLKLQHQHEIEKIESEHKHSIEKIESEHKHSIEKLEIEHKLEKDSKSDDMSTEMAMKFFTGELDLTKILSSIDDLESLQTQVKKMESKNNMSQFIKKK